MTDLGALSSNAPIPAAGIGVLPAARVHHNAAQACASGASITLAFNGERFDTDAIHDTATNNSRLTCKTAGLYVISFTGIWQGSTAEGWRSFAVRLNGATQIVHHQVVLSEGVQVARQMSLPITTLYQLAVNDYLEVIAFQDSGVSLDVQVVGNSSPEFAMAWLSP